MMAIVAKPLIADVSEITAVIFVREPGCFHLDLLSKLLIYKDTSKPT